MGNIRRARPWQSYGRLREMGTKKLQEGLLLRVLRSWHMVASEQLQSIPMHLLTLQ